MMRGRFATLLLVSLVCAITADASNSVVNLSHYDLMRPDFRLMREEGIVGVIHEVTYPPFLRDERYSGRQRDATRAGLLWGAYHYANGSDPIAQANHFLKTVETAWHAASPDSRPDQVLLVLDFEKNGHYPGGTMSVAQAARFVDYVHQRTGVYPGLYSGEYRLRAVLRAPNVSSTHLSTLARSWLWIANYHFKPHDIPPWGDWDMWQYTGDGVCDLPRSAYPKSVANISRAERNIFSGSVGELKAFWLKHSWMPGGQPET